MTKRVLLAALLGGIAMFAWTSLAHMVLPLGDAGIKELRNDQGVLSAMHASLGDASGFYFFPSTGLGPDATMQQKRAAMDQYGQKLAANPSGILIYHPAGAKPISAGQLGTEFFTELIESLLVVILLAQTRLTSFASRLGFVMVAGVLATIATNVSYWNWYGFPATYTAAYMTTGIVGFICAGRHRRGHEGASSGEDGGSGVGGPDLRRCERNGCAYNRVDQQREIDWPSPLVSGKVNGENEWPHAHGSITTFIESGAIALCTAVSTSRSG